MGPTRLPRSWNGASSESDIFAVASLHAHAYQQRLTLVLRRRRLSDPFDQMGFTFRTFDALHEQESRRKFGARAAYLTFSYNFGQQPRIR